MRHFKQKDYTPNSVVRPAELLEIFIKNQSEGKEKLAAGGLGNSSGVKAQFDYSLLLASQSEAPLYAGSLQSLLQLRERQSTVIERTYQKEFRDALMKEYGQTCLVCGIKEIKVLEAAHIVSVSEIYDKFKKNQDTKILEDVANPFNGLILCANHHIALDSGILKILQIDSGECIGVLESKDQVMLESIKDKSFKNVHAKRLEFINKKISNEN